MNLNIKLEDLKEKKELVSVVLLGGAAILLVWTFVTITQYLMLSTETEHNVLNAIKQSQRPQEKIDKVLDDTKALAQSLARNNLFAPPAREDSGVDTRPAPVNPVTEVSGILDNQANINGNWYSVGDDIRGSGGTARLTEIGIDYITVEFEGRTERLYTIDAPTYASDVSITNPMASMMGGGISINGNSITLSTSTANDILSRITQRGGGRNSMMSGGMMGGFGGNSGFGGGRGGGGRGGRGGGGRGGRGGF